MTNRGWCLLAGAALATSGCATPKPAADTVVTASVVNAANAIDTLKPAVVAAPDSPGATAAATTSTKATKAASTTARRDTAAVQDKHLGRDSVIKRDPADPSRMIPPKKP